MSYNFDETSANANCLNKPEEDDFEDEDEDEEEALSLRDLPMSDNSEDPSKKEYQKANESQEEFNFCLWSLDQNESELCAADDVFFQGQIVPMGISVIKHLHNCNQNERISSTMEPLNHSSSSGFTSESSRSSRISSLNSTNTASAASAAVNENKLPRTRVMNQFRNSQQSPKTHFRISSSATKNGYLSTPISRTGPWTLIRVGLVTTPEIGIQDLKIRNNCKKSNGIHNSNINNKKSEKKKQQSFFNKKGFLFNSCKCSASAIGTVNSGNIVMKRSGSNIKDEQHSSTEEKQQRAAGKQSLSHHRTFEWLKQLSLETATDVF